MSNLQSDIGALQQMVTKAQTVFDKLVQMRKLLGQLREARRSYENIHVMSLDEYLRDEQRRSGHLPDRDSEAVQKQYNAYEDTLQRKRDELSAQMERLRGQLQSVVSDLERSVAIILNDLETSGSHIRPIRAALRDAKRELNLSPQQLTLEHISSIERDIRDLHWLQDQA